MIGKKIITIFVSGLFVLIPISQSDAADIVMNIAFQAPTSHYSAQSVLYFKSQVELKSNGKIKVKMNDYGSWLKQQREEKNKKELPPLDNMSTSGQPCENLHSDVSKCRTKGKGGQEKEPDRQRHTPTIREWDSL